MLVQFNTKVYQACKTKAASLRGAVYEKAEPQFLRSLSFILTK